MAVAPKKATPATVNATLRDRGIAHAVLLEKLKISEANAIAAHFNDDVVPDLIAQLTARLEKIDERGIDLQPAVTNRMRALLELLQETVDAWTSGLSKDLADKLTDIGVNEVKWQDDLIQGVLPIEWDTVVPPTSVIREAIVNSPIDGVLLADVIARLGDYTKRSLEQAIRIGITEGESTDKIVARVRKVTDLSSNSAVAVTRTAIAHSANAARTSYYLDNHDLIKGVQWHATLDTRTCPTCMMLDGKVFPVDSGKRPPRHIMCRCTSIPVLRSMADLGLKLKDFTPSTRASMNGQVPESTTFGDWILRQPAAVQDEAVGPTRGALLRTGKITINDFVDPQGDIYTLDELRRRDAAAFDAADL